MPFPPAGPSRDSYVLSAVADRRFAMTMSAVEATIPGHAATFFCSSDALKVDGVRVDVSAYLQQQIAGLLSCSLLTAKLADLLFAQRGTTVPPLPRPITSSTEAMIDQSAKIDAYAEGATGIVQTVGKHWVIDNLLAQHAGRAVNYGWHFDGPTFQGQKWDLSVTGSSRLIQGRGFAHDAREQDYSQVCCLVARSCLVDGVAADLWTVLADPELAPLASAQGVVRVTRQPGVPVLQPVTSPDLSGIFENASWSPGSAIGWSIAGGIALAVAGAIGIAYAASGA